MRVDENVMSEEDILRDGAITRSGRLASLVEIKRFSKALELVEEIKKILQILELRNK